MPALSMPPPVLQFEGGTLVAPALPEGVPLEDLFLLDRRTGVHRARAMHYRDAILRARAAGTGFVDEARRFEPLPLALERPIRPHPYQTKALEAWQAAGSHRN